MIKLFEDWNEERAIKDLLLEFAQKDLTRIQDIVKKANGDQNKMISLASTMAKSITDKVKAADRGHAAEEVLGKDNPLSKIFYDRATELGADVKSEKEKASGIPGSKRPDAKRASGSGPGWSRPSPILPCGSLNLQTGENKYFNINDKYQINSTLEVWKDLGHGGSKEKYRIVITSGSSPIEGIGSKRAFVHDQSGRDIFGGVMVDYIEAAHAKSLIPLYGKSLLCYVYK